MKYKKWWICVGLTVCLMVGGMPGVVYAENSMEQTGSVEENSTQRADTEEIEEGSTEEGGVEGSAEKSSEDDLWPGGPQIVGEAGILMEVSTGTILYEKNIHQTYYPASITKILTVLVAIENCDLEELVTVPHEAVYMEDKGSHIALDEGEQITVKDCLYGIMLASANDAAYALAVHVGGSIDGFAQMMNDKAKELGCVDSHFTNPHGLPDENHVSSAYDMALITRAALSYDVFREIASTTYYEIPATELQKDQIPMSNHHKMLTAGKYHYEGAFAGKTGYTTVALNTLVTCAKRDDMELICVTMKTAGKQVYVDTASLFDFGFENFEKVSISEEEKGYREIAAGELEPLCERTIRTLPEEGKYVVLPKNVGFAAAECSLSYTGSNGANADVACLTYSYGGKEVGSAELLWQDYGVDDQVFDTREPEPETESTTEEAQDENTKKEKKGKWWLIALIVVCVLLAAGGVVLVCLPDVRYNLVIYLSRMRKYSRKRRRRRKKARDNRRRQMR